MAFGSMSPQGMFPSMANPGAPADNSPGQMGLQILKTALAQRKQGGGPPSLLPQVFGGGAAPASGAPAAPGGGPGMLQGLLAKMGLGGGGDPAAAGGAGGGFNPLASIGDAFKQNAMQPMRDPNTGAMMQGPPPNPMPGMPGGAANVPLPPVKPPALAAAAPQVPPMMDAGTPIIPTALTGIGLA